MQDSGLFPNLSLQSIYSLQRENSNCGGGAHRLPQPIKTSLVVTRPMDHAPLDMRATRRAQHRGCSFFFSRMQSQLDHGSLSSVPEIKDIL